MKVILLTGSELRHDFFRKYIANDTEIIVLASFCESEKRNLNEMVRKDQSDNTFRLKHLSARSTTERDFFELYCDSTRDLSNPNFIEKGNINNTETVKYITDLKPDLIISYGCSIIKSELLNTFANRFINIHLGLSPYYRGSGTNFWPFVNRELQCIGTTFMYIDHGIDTGQIIHQIRAKISSNDNIHQIGNRLIRDSFTECLKIIKFSSKLKKMDPIPFSKDKERYYRKIDFTEDSLKVAYQNLSKGLINEYLENKVDLDKKYPIISNSSL